MMRAEFLGNLWRWSCGLPEREPRTVPPYEVLVLSQWSPAFERLMRNRLIMGAFRYGLLGSASKESYDNIGSAIQRLEEYRKTGNAENLVDAANLCLVEFEEGRHPLRHFAAADDAAHVERREA